MSKIYDILKAKFSEFNIPPKISNSFLDNFQIYEDGLLPEFELKEVPSDECFKTLQTFCNTVSDKYVPNEFIIHKLLHIPFSKIQATKDLLMDFIDVSSIEQAYLKPEMYFVEPVFINELRFFLESKNINNYSIFFIEALILGKSAIDRVNEIFELLDISSAEKIVSQAYIWYPYSDPVGLIKYMLDQGLTNTQISDVLIHDPILIMNFRKERTLRAGHNQEYVDHTIAKVK